MCSADWAVGWVDKSWRDYDTVSLRLWQRGSHRLLTDPVGELCTALDLNKAAGG